MASQAIAGQAPFEEELPGFVLIRADEIDRDDRLRAVDPIWAQALGQIMKREGQRTPIEVCRLPGRNRWTLVAGGHRHEGAMLAEIEFLRAEIVSADRDERRSREISENLWRDDLAPLDRAAFIAETVAIQKRRAGIDPAKDGRAISAAVRWQRVVAADAEDATATLAVAYDLSAELVDAIGLSARTIRDDLMLNRRLPWALTERLREADHPILWHHGQLKALAKLDEAAQVRAVETLIGGAKSVAEATRPAGGNRPADPEAKRLSTFIGTFQRMGLAERKAALFQLAGMLPAGVTLGTDVDGKVLDEAALGLKAALDYFDERTKWDPASRIELFEADATKASSAARLALMSVNVARKGGK